ncbi:LPS-assembly protein LptD [Phenylobacterium zucineum]|nr:LPS-assembly protein LptD [Phenylobacterium zucineum]
MAGAALALLWSAAAHAQAPESAAPAQAQPGPDGLLPDEMYIEADEVIREDETGRTTAQGNLEIRYNDRTLRADRLVYEEDTGVIRAFGNIVIVNADGSTEYADEAVLDDDMRAGVVLGFAARLSENVKIAAASAARRNDNIQELNRAIYTPCEICAADGTPKKPTWSIAADKVVQDKKRRIVYYRHARFRLFGASVLYLPLFWHADPQAGRSSGFLTPKASFSDRRGFSYEQPYYQVISPSADMIISPQINTKIAPFLNGQVRKRFYSGDVDVRFGYTHARDFDGQGNEIVGTRTDRSYILGRGSFEIDEKWRWGFTAERTSDDLIFDKYEVGRVYVSRGPYVADDRRLISQVYAIRQDERSYFSAAAMTIQGLRPEFAPGDQVARGENDRVFPVIGPLVEGHYELPGMVAGGRLRVHTSAVVLSREQSQFFPEQRLPGIDSARLTGEVDWRRTFTSAAGVRLSPFVNLRADAYRIQDILTGVGSATRKDELGRGLATVGLDLTYPFFKRSGDATIVVEPVVQLAASPDAKQVVIGEDPVTGEPIYLNEDSVAFEFDETTLFRPNKFPGYDLYEDGVRLNVAGRASVLWDDGRRANLLVGRAFRTEENRVFSERSGLRSESSDWIVAADAQPVRGLSMFARARLDSDDFDIHRLEAGANVYNRYGNGFVRYLTDDFDITGRKRENLDLGGEVYVGKNWGVSFYGNRDLNEDAWVIRDLGVFYRDDCIRVDVVYRREDTIIGRLLPSESVSVRLTLATLGGTSDGR